MKRQPPQLHVHGPHHNTHLHIFRQSFEDGGQWEVWLNKNGENFSGHLIGTGATKELAIIEAQGYLIEAMRLLNQS